MSLAGASDPNLFAGHIFSGCANIEKCEGKLHKEVFWMEYLRTVAKFIEIVKPDGLTIEARSNEKFISRKTGKKYNKSDVQTFSNKQQLILKKFLLKYSDQLRRNIYFSPNPVNIERNTKRTYLLSNWGAGKAKKAEKLDVLSMNWIYVDIDPVEQKNPNYDPEDPNSLSHIPLTEEEFIQQRVEIFSKLNNYCFQGVSLKPTIIIDSGNGFQGLWRLKIPRIIVGNTDQEKLTDMAYLEGFNRQVIKDLDADKTHNIERVLRLPGPLNPPTPSKVKKGRVARKTSFIFNDVSYTFKQFGHSTVSVQKVIQPLPDLKTAPIPERFFQLLEIHDNLESRWKNHADPWGSKTDDHSRSAKDQSLVAILKREEFSADESFGILRAFQHGKMNPRKTDAVPEQNQPRYFEKMWSKVKTANEWLLEGGTDNG